MSKMKKKFNFPPEIKCGLILLTFIFFGKILECLKTVPGTILGK